MEEKYPLFLIDRSKRGNYPFDYIMYLKNPFGFIARILYFNKDEPYNEFVEKTKEIMDNLPVAICKKFDQGGIILVVEDFLYYFDITEENNNIISSLLEHALQNYLATERERTPDGLSIDDQILIMEQSVEEVKNNLHKRISTFGKEIAEYQLRLFEEVLNTLKRHKRIITEYPN